MLKTTCIVVLLWSYLPSLAYGQQFLPEPGAEAVSETAPAAPPESKRIFGIFPNNRSSPSLVNYAPLSRKEKFEIAQQDSFDRGTIFMAAVFGANAEHTRANPSFGQGAAGYSRSFGTAYGDMLIGNYMTEAIYPAMLHQDPRYFRRGTGSMWSRLGYATGQIFWTHTDSGGTQFNYSEVLGNSTAVAVSESYYPDHRNVTDAAGKLGMQIGIDMASNVLKEFWPDIGRMLSRKPRP